MNKSAIILTSFAIALGMILSGCGETVTGMVKDTKRIGGGIKQVFVRDSS